jgi:hypothetical protein
VTRSNWGTALGGVLNAAWGTHKLIRGVTVLVLSPGCLAAVKICAGYGGFTAAGGLFKIRKGAGQMVGGLGSRCRASCSFLGQMRRTGRAMLPRGLADWLASAP